MGAKALQMRTSENKTQTAIMPFSIGNIQMKSGTIQRYIPIKDFFPFIKKYDNDTMHRLMYWNSTHMFDDVKGNKDESKAKIIAFSTISESVGGAELAPGQTHVDQRLPGYLSYFSNFTTDLPDGMGSLTFKKSFDRLTEHGWISDNVVLPKAKFNNKKVAVHVILAVSETTATSESVTVNPHVTVRVKEIQDKFDQIAMINNVETKGEETKRLGLDGARNSLSVGISSDRAKEETNAQTNVGIEMDDLKNIFGKPWLAGIVSDAWNAARGDANTAKTKEFLVKGYTPAKVIPEDEK
jgi:hypothetical protein